MRRSPVASNCSSADPNWKPCVHSVHPRDVYRPATVNTGVPCLGSQCRSISAIFFAESSKTRSTAGRSDAGVRAVSMRIMAGRFGQSREMWKPPSR